MSPSRSRVTPDAGRRRRPPVAVMAAGSILLAACAELAPEPPRTDVEGCYRLSLEEVETARAPGPPSGLELTDLPFLPDDASDAQVSRHRFDARTAREAFLVYPDTAYRVAWWWEDEYQRRFGVGNRNTAAAFYVDAIVRGDRLEGSMNRWRYDDQGQPLMSKDAYVWPLSGRRAPCDRPR